MHTMKEVILTELHELVGLCGHCGKRNCAGRKSQSFLPGEIPYEKVIEAIDKVLASQREDETVYSQRTEIDIFKGYIADLETKLAQSQQELVELRLVHRQMVNGIRDLGEKLIDDTVG